MQHEVFISYTTHDKPAADAICHALEAQGIRCWIAPRDIPSGHNYAETLIQAINATKLMVLIFSGNTNSSRHVGNEVERAFNRNIPVIPFRIEDTPATGALEYFLSMPHWLDAFTPPLQQHLNSLVESVRALLVAQSGQAKAESPVTVAAPIVPLQPPATPVERKKSKLPFALAAAVIVIAAVGLGASYVGRAPKPAEPPVEAATQPPPAAQPSPPAPNPQPPPFENATPPQQAAPAPATAPVAPADQASVPAPPPAPAQTKPSQDSGSPGFGWVGIIVQGAVSDDDGRDTGAGGIGIREVGRNSPAAKAGIKPGDVIMSFDGKAAGKVVEMVQMIGDKKAGQSVEIVIMRDGRKIPFHLTAADLKQAAEGGNPDAMFILGNFSFHRDKDAAEAMRWYRKAADLGQTNAMVVIGMKYSDGQDVPQNYSEAMRWYRKAADLGDTGGMVHIALLYLNGRGVAMNRIEAARWYRMAADLGNPAAMTWVSEHGRLGLRDRQMGR